MFPSSGTADDGSIRRRILLVDDHVDMVTVYRQLLTHQGYDVIGAFPMTEALNICEEETFDLVITDIGLPDGDGVELLRRLTVRRSVPAIAVSDYGTQADVDRSLAAGFATHLVKPFSVKSLQEAIRNALEQKR